MRLPTFNHFVDITATALLVGLLIVGAFAMGGLYAQMKVREQCDGLNLVLLAGHRYECVSLPRQPKEQT